MKSAPTNMGAKGSLLYADLDSFGCIPEAV